jgi:cytochrome c551/c552
MNRLQTLRGNWKRTLGISVVTLIVLFVAIQLIPVNRTNPAVVSEPTWDSPATRALAKEACFDCHSNETVWPWYSKIAPVSWLTWNDVRGGRERLNFSDWGTRHIEVGEIARVIDEGEMPPWYYVLRHPKAKLSDSEKQALIDGLSATISQSSGG